MDLNTEILASMIEKGSRFVVRSSVEALLRDAYTEDVPETTEGQATEGTAYDDENTSDPCDNLDDDGEGETAVPSYTPKRKISEERVSGLFVITPRDASSPSSFEESDSEDRPVILSIPHNFSNDQPKSVLAPLPSRTREMEDISSFSARLPMMKKFKADTPTVVTPSKTVQNFVEGKGPGPNLPTLLEAARHVNE